MSPPAPPSSLPSTAGPGQVRPRGPGLCPRPPPAPQQPGPPPLPAPSLGPGLGYRAEPCRHRPQLGTVPVLHHLSWPRVHPLLHAGAFDGGGAHGPAPAAVSPARGHTSPPGQAVCGVPALSLLRLGWPGQGQRCPTRRPPAPATLATSWASTFVPAQPAASRLPAASPGPVRLHPCPSTAIMARPQPLLPACPLPAHPTVAAAACSVDRSPPAPESVGQGSAAPCARGPDPPVWAGTPSHRPCSAGRPRAPLCFVPGQGCVRCRPGQWGSAGACTALALPAAPLHPCPPTCLAPTW